MNQLARLGRFAKDPYQSTIRVLGRKRPDLLFDRYSRQTRKLGIDRTIFILSFDCDTEKDIEVVEDLHQQLLECGIQAVYAVPGELLECGADVYRRLAESGAEFINHGYTRHTWYDETIGEYKSCFFYDQMPLEQVAKDIRQGHEAHLQVLGKAPKGFRTPHFGTFQGTRHLTFLHRTLVDLGYTFSTSTVPAYGLRYGPLRKVAGKLWEIPVSGYYDKPDFILDSWGARAAPGRLLDEAGYYEQIDKMVKCFSSHDRVGVLNYYVDPLHVFDWPGFFDCIKLVAPFAISSYAQLLQTVEKARH